MGLVFEGYHVTTKGLLIVSYPRTHLIVEAIWQKRFHPVPDVGVRDAFELSGERLSTLDKAAYAIEFRGSDKRVAEAINIIDGSGE